ncbi:hypothetical protein [Fibrivirga algicola]|uniref:Uncharacterized protein n=1 Tax=Fibrivirga algicola TaxID=2950420 RepID=A0ABX0QQZ0_9BACT|nr:hypothetical protein [Fibrivirga algicola]ARK11539.1 hypothetical protein A6C57_15070 [Fibrella sp. ES10-3-2-2]NID12599.1 hypothetical protein [Fibrivirga algicola]
MDICNTYRDDTVNMNLDQFVLLSSVLGDELYREDGKQSATASLTIEKHFQLLANKPIGAYMTSGLPTFWPRKKTVPRFF